MSSLHEVTLLLGSNLGEREQILARAVAEIASRIGPVVQKSRIYETDPWGNFTEENTPGFLNQAVVVQSHLAAQDILRIIHAIEREAGREKDNWDVNPGPGRLYNSRVLDVDIIFYDDQRIDTENLIVPHPRLTERRFVLEPLREIMPDYVHPILKITISELFNSLLLGESK